MSLFAFYNERLRNISNEKQIYDNHIKNILPDYHELDILRWEISQQEQINYEFYNKEMEIYDTDLKNLQDKVKDLENQLSNISHHSDIKAIQIQRLNDLLKPVTKDITFIVPNDHMKKYNQNTFTSSRKTNSTEVSSSERICGIQTVAKTGDLCKLETENSKVVNEINNMLSMLNQNIDEELKLSDVESQEYSKLQVKHHDAMELIKNVHKIESHIHLTISEILRLRLNTLVSQREDIEELHQLQYDQNFYQKNEAIQREKFNIEIENIKKESILKENSLKSQYQKQIGEIDKKISRLEKDVKLQREEHTNTLSKLQRDIDAINERHEKLRERHVLEYEGYQNEIIMLNQRLKHIYKLRQMEINAENIKKVHPNSLSKLPSTSSKNLKTKAINTELAKKLLLNLENSLKKLAI